MRGCLKARPNFAHFDRPVKIRGGMGEMSEGKIKVGLRINLWYTFDGRPLRRLAERNLGKSLSAKLKAYRHTWRGLVSRKTCQNIAVIKQTIAKR